MKIAIVKRMVLLMVVVATGLESIGQNQDSTTVNKPAEKKILTLDDCIAIAMKNNIQLKQTRNNAHIAKANNFQSIMNFLPNVNGFGNFSLNNGTSFNSNIGQFATGSNESSFLSVSANMVLFNGMNNFYNKKATSLALESNVNLIKAQEQTVQASVLGSYLAVVLDKENIKISEARIDLLSQQLEREKKRHSVGVGNLEQVYNFQSQLANENLRLVNLQNQLLTDQLTLLQILQIEVSRDYEVAPYPFDEEVESVLEKEKYAEVLEESRAYSPSLKSAMANANAAHYNFKRTQTSMVPTVSLIGDYSTQYSSLLRDNADQVIPIGEQYENLTNKGLELRLTVPIFNNYRNKTNTQVSKLNKENAELQLDQAELDVTNTVQRVYLDLINAQETYKAAEDNMVALNQSFEFVKTRYEHGNTDFYTYLESLNNKNRAEIELVNAKYSIIFRKKILDVYRGLL
ncbi:MAG: TolC family protein [Reichenbachiella sp.]|uniref:TolC family protein n=1 Tax=Reichenbachiella sp. TaxID=2184521 RepID=UPI0029673A90|nr:TolC family protein [Reichenbachiella sp.]MDW3211873.1 TolC family protein [Reichenbachiella sp.]